MEGGVMSRWTEVSGERVAGRVGDRGGRVGEEGRSVHVTLTLPSV